MKMTVREVAKRIGVCASLVYGLIQSRMLAHYRVGGKGKRGRILVDETDLEAYLQACRVDPQTAAPSVKPQVGKPKLRYLKF
jgi:excisionase family DNA binding protein